MYSKWKTATPFFSWQHVQAYIDRIDPQIYRISIDTAKELHLYSARSCPNCQCQASKLFWLSVSSPQERWKRHEGKVGFLTICETCQLQVNFLVDEDLTTLQTQDWENNQIMH